VVLLLKKRTHQVIFGGWTCLECGGIVRVERGPRRLPLGWEKKLCHPGPNSRNLSSTIFGLLRAMLALIRAAPCLV